MDKLTLRQKLTPRYMRNRFLRIRIITTTDINRAELSEWTWGADGPNPKEAHVSTLSVLHDLADVFGYNLAIWLPDDQGTVDRKDPRWDTEGKLKVTKW